MNISYGLNNDSNVDNKNDINQNDNDKNINIWNDDLIFK